MNGLVVKNTGSWYVVKTEDASINCKIKGHFRLKGIRTTNPVAVGDHVTIEENTDGTGFITEIEPRRNYIIRRASNLSKESHIIAANLDQAFLIISFAEPLTPTVFIDRFLATAEAYRIPATIVINKIDLLDDEGREYMEAFRYLYETIGYQTIAISAETGDVHLGATHASVSAVHHTGMHTTTFSEMYPLPDGGYIVDTPGIKGFGTIDFKEEEVSHYFPEIFAESRHCRYSNCKHLQEPGCAVKKALEEHRISQSRYAGYLSILEDCNPDKYRKPF